MDLLAEFKTIVATLMVDPLAAADMMDALADRIKTQAAAVRGAVAAGLASEAPGGIRETGQFSDKVRVRLCGHDGLVKQESVVDG